MNNLWMYVLHTFEVAQPVQLKMNDEEKTQTQKLKKLKNSKTKKLKT